jgi:hypothetical protein
MPEGFLELSVPVVPPPPDPQYLISIGMQAEAIAAPEPVADDPPSQEFTYAMGKNMAAYSKLHNEAKVREIKERLKTMLTIGDFARMHKFVTEGERLVRIRNRSMKKSPPAVKEVRLQSISCRFTQTKERSPQEQVDKDGVIQDDENHCESRG